VAQPHREVPSSAWYWGDTVLHVAAREGRVDALRAVLGRIGPARVPASWLESPPLDIAIEEANFAWEGKRRRNWYDRMNYSRGGLAPYHPELHSAYGASEAKRRAATERAARFEEAAWVLACRPDLMTNMAEWTHYQELSSCAPERLKVAVKALRDWRAPLWQHIHYLHGDEDWLMDFQAFARTGVESHYDGEGFLEDLTHRHGARRNASRRRQARRATLSMRNGLSGRSPQSRTSPRGGRRKCGEKLLEPDAGERVPF